MLPTEVITIYKMCLDRVLDSILRTERTSVPAQFDLRTGLRFSSTKDGSSVSVQGSFQALTAQTKFSWHAQAKETIAEKILVAGKDSSHL